LCGPLGGQSPQSHLYGLRNRHLGLWVGRVERVSGSPMAGRKEKDTVPQIAARFDIVCVGILADECRTIIDLLEAD
jgi:hypothetical protein